MSLRGVFLQLVWFLPNFHECFCNSIETQKNVFSISSRKYHGKERETTCSLWSSKCKFSLLVPSLCWTARGTCSSVFPLSYRNTIFNQSARIHVQCMYFLKAVFLTHLKNAIVLKVIITEWCFKDNPSFFIAITPPTIDSFSGETTIKEGTQKVIKCVAKASPRPSADWYRNGKKLTSTNCTSANDKSCKNVIYEVYEENAGSALHTTYTIQVLKIRSALYPRDQGMFVCKATNGKDPPAELGFDLDVQGTVHVHVL